MGLGAQLLKVPLQKRFQLGKEPIQEAHDEDAALEVVAGDPLQESYHLDLSLIHI